MLTDEKKKLIEKMWAEYYTSGQIALAIGVTRSSVMGYVNRQKLLRNPGAIKQNRINKVPKKEPKKDRYVKLISIDGRLIRKRSVTITPEKKVDLSKNTLMFLTPEACRFVLGQVQAEKTNYCCQPIEKGSYCAFHAQICYQKKPDKEERKRKVSAFRFRK